MLKALRILAVIPAVIYIGCAKYKLPSPTNPKYAISQAVDADQNGVIDEKDVQSLGAKAKECFDIGVRPFFDEAGIELEIEEDVFKEENTDILKEKLTVVKWEKLTDGVNEWNKIRVQLEATKIRLEKEPAVVDFGVIRGLAYYPDRLICVLDDERYVHLIGISIPTHASKYRKMSDDMFYKLARRKIAKIEYDVKRTSGNEFLLAYIHVGDVFVNAEMLARGYAKANPTPPNHKYDDLFMKLEKEARERKRGIWAFPDSFQ